MTPPRAVNHSTIQQLRAARQHLRAAREWLREAAAPRALKRSLQA